MANHTKHAVLWFLAAFSYTNKGRDGEDTALACSCCRQYNQVRNWTLLLSRRMFTYSALTINFYYIFYSSQSASWFWLGWRVGKYRVSDDKMRLATFLHLHFVFFSSSNGFVFNLTGLISLVSLVVEIYYVLKHSIMLVKKRQRSTFSDR